MAVSIPRMDTDLQHRECSGKVYLDILLLLLQWHAALLTRRELYMGGTSQTLQMI